MNAVVGIPASSSIKHQALRSLASPLQNKLLASLPQPVRQRLFPHLEVCFLTPGMVLLEPGVDPDYFYFPADCLVTRHCMMGDAVGTAISVVGNDGLVGIDAFMDNGSAPTTSVVQMTGTAFRIESQWIKEELNRFGELLTLMFRYAHGLLTQMAQTAVCSRHHTMEQQFGRWLLLCFDRVPGDTLNMTQDQIALSLGVRRQTVTEATGKLQKRGIIKCSRGHVTLLDRGALEATSCGCAEIVRRETDRSWPCGAPHVDSSLQCADACHYH